MQLGRRVLAAMALQLISVVVAQTTASPLAPLARRATSTTPYFQSSATCIPNVAALHDDTIDPTTPDYRDCDTLSVLLMLDQARAGRWYSVLGQKCLSASYKSCEIWFHLGENDPDKAVHVRLADAVPQLYKWSTYCFKEQNDALEGHPVFYVSLASTTDKGLGLYFCKYHTPGWRRIDACDSDKTTYVRYGDDGN